MKKKIILIIYFVLIVVTGSEFLKSNTFDAVINIDTSRIKKGVVTNKLFGGFTEFLLDYINGPNGIWAQEFMDRGFDMNDEKSLTSLFWKTYRSKSSVYEIYLKSKGYNENGLFYQYLRNYKKDTEIGVYQTIVNDDTSGIIFYCYILPEVGNPDVYLTVYDTTLSKVLYQKVFKSNSLTWKKISDTIKPIQNYSRVSIMISIKSEGAIGIDEASAMPANNINGIRREYFDLFKKWNMGTLRYPGGCFADFYTTRWYYSIGDIDKRKTPLYGDRGYRQRMDFGLHEFMWLCDTLNIEPYLTTNFKTGTIEEAMNWVKYCNYDTTDYYGKLRFRNGSLKPFNVKIWEIGNEQWYDGVEYAKGYVPFYDSLIKVDPNIQFILATDVWPGKLYFDSTMDIIQDKAHIYGYHPILYTTTPEIVEEVDKYLNTVSLPVNYEYMIKELNKWITEKNLNKKIMQGSTEWGFGYSAIPYLLFDTTDRASSLENGLFYAGKVLSYIRFADILSMSNVTLGYGFIRRGYNSVTGKRSIIGAPSYQMLSMISNHFGENLIEYELDCPLYNTRDIKGFWSVYQQKWLDMAVTGSKDTIFIAVINKHPYDTAITTININDLNYDVDMTIYQFTSEHFLDQNSFDNPHYILPKQWTEKYSDTYYFPKHSLTILAIPIKDKKIDTVITEVNFRIYPNPANRTLNIDNNFGDNSVFIEIIDVNGNKCEFKIISKSSTCWTIDLSLLSAGKYFIKLHDNNKIIQSEFIIEK